MSRAFVKEDSGADSLPERPVSPHRNLVTRRGLALIEAELARHRAARARILHQSITTERGPT